MRKKNGTGMLYGVSVGPGDPELRAQSALVSQCGLPEEQLWPDLAFHQPNTAVGYFATVLIKE